MAGQLPVHSNHHHVRVLMLARSLERGGAERQLCTLANALSANGHSVHVALFYAGGNFEALLEPAVNIIHLAKKGRYDFLTTANKIRHVSSDIGIDVLHSWMVDGNVAAAIALGRKRTPALVWDVRASNVDLRRYGIFPRLAFRASCTLSRGADLIVANSDAGKKFHASCGYPLGRMRTIPNGINTNMFRRKPAAHIRDEWGLTTEAIAIGLVARIDPMKDHETFLAAAAAAYRKEARTRFVLVGDGDQAAKSRLHHFAAKAGVSPAIVWAGERPDMPEVYSALDVVCSSSAFGEGFSNAVAEAMSCETPCIGTDVGDTASIIDGTGWVVPPGEPDSLTNAILQAARLAQPIRAESGRAARRRILEGFSIEAMASNYERAYRDAIAHRASLAA